MARLPQPPDDLAPPGRGRKFWRQTVAEYELAVHELELLAEACRTMDELDQLRAAVAADGPTVTGSRGQTRVHPAMLELRQGRAELRRLLDALAIPASQAVDGADEGNVASLASRRARRAAHVRWAGRGVA